MSFPEERTVSQQFYSSRSGSNISPQESRVMVVPYWFHLLHFLPKTLNVYKLL